MNLILKITRNGLLLVTMLTLGALTMSCAVTHKIGSPEGYDKKLVETYRIPGVVGVARGEKTRAGIQLRRRLEKTGVFDGVQRGTQGLIEGDWIAEAIEYKSGERITPWATTLTLGIWPTYWRQSYVLDFRLKPVGGGENIEINHEVKTHSIVGWWAMLHYLCPAYTGIAADKQDRYYDILKWNLMMSGIGSTAPVASEENTQ